MEGMGKGKEKRQPMEEEGLGLVINSREDRKKNGVCNAITPLIQDQSIS